MRDGPLVAPLMWLGIRRATSERIDRFTGRLVFCFFPAAPIFWLISHFIGGGRVLFAVWILLLAWIVKRSWESDIMELNMGAIGDALLDRGLPVSDISVAKANFRKWFTFDLIIIIGIIYDVNLPAWLLTSLVLFFVIVPIIERKRILAYMMSDK
jgi:hypothetical protein